MYIYTQVNFFNYNRVWSIFLEVKWGVSYANGRVWICWFFNFLFQWLFYKSTRGQEEKRLKPDEIRQNWSNTTVLYICTLGQRRTIGVHIYHVWKREYKTDDKRFTHARVIRHCEQWILARTRFAREHMYIYII